MLKKRHQYNPDVANFCLFGKYGDAQTMRGVCLRIAMGDCSDLDSLHIRSAIDTTEWEDGLIPSAGAILQTFTFATNPMDRTIARAAHSDNRLWHNMLAIGRADCRMFDTWDNVYYQLGICPLSAEELSYAFGKPVTGKTSVNYKKSTMPELRQMSAHYAKNRYRLQNLMFLPHELQFLCIRMALGKLPREYMYYYDGNALNTTSSTVPAEPTEGAQIIAKPLDRVIAEYHDGAWTLNPTADLSDNQVAMTADMLMYIGRKPVRTVRA